MPGTAVSGAFGGPGVTVPVLGMAVGTRCRFLRVDTVQLGWLEEMTTNAAARHNVWLGEVAALEENLTYLRRRRAEAEARRADPAVQFRLRKPSSFWPG
jgi:hypothetical protein